MGIAMHTTTTAARRAGVTRRAIQKAIRLGQLRAEKFGSAWAIAERDLAAWLATRRKPGRPPAHPGDASAIRVPLADDDDSAEYIREMGLGRLLPPR